MKPRYSNAFADAHFPGCEAHYVHASGVHEVLEKLARRPIPNPSPDATVREVLGDAELGAAGDDSHDQLEMRLALKGELADESAVNRALSAWVAERTLRALLGPLRDRCAWDPEILWLRSVRGLINERVHHAGGCTCAEKAVR